MQPIFIFPTTISQPDQLARSCALTAKTRQLCLSLESGAADILELVTPTTAELLAYARLRPLAQASLQQSLL